MTLGVGHKLGHFGLLDVLEEDRQVGEDLL